MASSLFNGSGLLSESTREKLNKSKAYRISRYLLAALIITLAIFTLVGAWGTDWTDATAGVKTDNPFPVISDAAGKVTGEFHRAPSESLYQADLAFGIIGIILAVAILGSRKQPFNLVLFILGIVFVAILVALVSISFDQVVIVRLFVPATIAGV